ncbi:hypothetical protein TI39_contig343g00015 [Zymoseptoria brevis]|uniref:MYND-type domain-containing protein n=1 Tax=Zymoseptoria brevis TaxID=1047168 RepID=A0A0F4GV43_9PEZI|nr:hypothetical protein TI39_contig343g00015 [Zymoseptoria brevis]
MATMTGTERSRLIKLGKVLVLFRPLTSNAALLAEAVIAKDLQSERRIAFYLHNDAQELLILGDILGAHGTAFTTQGKKTRRTLLEVCGIEIDEMTIAMQLYLWKERQTMDNAMGNELGIGEEILEEAEGAPLYTKDFLAWSEDVLRFPAAALRQKCTFCGDAATDYRVLQACGSCKKTLYCDKRCQKMHWRKEHKIACKKAAGAHKAEELKAEKIQENKSEEAEAEDIQDVERTKEVSQEDSKLKQSQTADNNVEESKGGHRSID